MAILKHSLSKDFRSLRSSNTAADNTGFTVNDFDNSLHDLEITLRNMSFCRKGLKHFNLPEPTTPVQPANM